MKDLAHYAIIGETIAYLTFGLLFCYLAAKIKMISGKNWLIAFSVINLLSLLVFRTIHLIGTFVPGVGAQIFKWFEVTGLIYPFGYACLAMFLFANWSKGRMKVKPYDLLFSYKGRIPRSAFWIASFCVSPIGILFSFAAYTADAGGLVKFVLWVLYLLWLIPAVWIGLALYTKRWHDCGKSGWMSLIMLIPIVGAIYVIYYAGFVKGTAGTNLYGEDPLELDRVSPQ